MTTIKKPDELILVAGGTGFLGGQVVRELAGLGYNLLVIGLGGKQTWVGLKSEDSWREQPISASMSEISYIQADLTDEKALAGIRNQLSGVTKVVHLAGKICLHPGKTKTGGTDDKETVDNYNPDKVAAGCEIVDYLERELSSNLSGLVNLLKVLPPKLNHFVLASSCSVYATNAHIPVKESASTYPPTPYGAGKLAAEVFAGFYCQRLGIPITILRFTQLYGSGEPHNQFITTFIKSCLENKVITLNNGGKDVRDLLHVTDAAKAVARAVVLMKPGVFNIASGKGFSTEELALACAVVTHTKPKLNVLAGEGATTIIYDITKAKRELGFEPRVPLLEGLRTDLLKGE